MEVVGDVEGGNCVFGAPVVIGSRNVFYSLALATYALSGCRCSSEDE
jgi:hypothetical protein